VPLSDPRARTQLLSTAPFSSPGPHLSQLERAEGCPLCGEPLSKLPHWRNHSSPESKPNQSLFPLYPLSSTHLMHYVIDRAAPHPPLSVALPQVHPEATTATGAPCHRPKSIAPPFFSASPLTHLDGESPATPTFPTGSPRPTGPLPSATPLRSPRRANASRATVPTPSAMIARGRAYAAPLARPPCAGIAAEPGRAPKPWGEVGPTQF
jgi:hypothetical protein